MLYENVEDFAREAEHLEVLTATVKIPPALGKYLVWTYIPVSDILNDIDSIKGMPSNTAGRFKDELNQFIQALEMGLLSFSCFSDVWIPDYILCYLSDPEYSEEDAKIDGDEAARMFESTPQKYNSSQHLSTTIKLLLDTLTKKSELIAYLPSCVSEGPLEKTADDMLTCELFFSHPLDEKNTKIH